MNFFFYFQQGPSNVWQNLFATKTHMEFKELPAVMDLFHFSLHYILSTIDCEQSFVGRSVVVVVAKLILFYIFTFVSSRTQDIATNVAMVFDPVDVTVRPITLHPLRTSAGLLSICCLAHTESR